MGLINAILGTASQIDAGKLREEFAPLLVNGEEISAAYKVVRDLFVFTQYRLILADKQGLTGKKVQYHSVPYKSITQFSVETAGHFDMDSELKIWISGLPLPITREFKKGTAILGIQKTLATYILANSLHSTARTPPLLSS